jgi:hypothetical protein
MTRLLEVEDRHESKTVACEDRQSRWLVRFDSGHELLAGEDQLELLRR